MLPEVVAAYYLAGSDDFLVHVAVRDTAHLHELAIDGFASREEIDRMETSLIFEHRTAAALPVYS